MFKLSLFSAVFGLVIAGLLLFLLTSPTYRKQDESDMSSSAKKEAALKSFRSITNATPQDAHRILKAHGYRLEAATNAFFSDEQAQLNAGSVASKNSVQDKKSEKESRDRLNALFDQFKDEDEDQITIDGALEMCEALEISPEDVVFLPLSFYLKSASIGTFTRSDYVQGWKTLDQSDTLAKQKQTLATLRKELYDNKPIRLERVNEDQKASVPSTLKGKGLYERVYDYTYSFARQEGQKSLGKIRMCALKWEVVLTVSFLCDMATNSFG